MTPLHKIEHLSDFTSHPWCNALLSDPTITHISKRHIPDNRAGVSNTFFTQTLFTNDAIRAFLSMYRPGAGRKREPGEDVFTGSSPALHAFPVTDNDVEEEKRQAAKIEKVFDVEDPDAPEAIILVSIGSGIDGGTNRLHGGVTATLLDQVMGSLISQVYEHTCATSDLSVKYKAAVNTPCILLCRAKLIREKGRWIETRGWVEDGRGKVFAVGEGAFVMNKVVTAKM